MIKEAQREKKLAFGISQSPNLYPSKLNCYEPNRYEKKILLPYLGVSSLQSIFTQISNKKSTRYDWYSSAPQNIWASGIESSLTECRQQNFGKFVNYDRLINYYQIRPVEIPFTDIQGNRHKYQPLILLSYFQDLTYASMRPALIDVRSDDEVYANWKFFYPALRAANCYARANGWRFLLIRDYFFNTPIFHNACFLSQFRHYPAMDPYFSLLINKIRRLKKMSIQKLIEEVIQNADSHDELLVQLWRLLDMDFVGFNLAQPLTLNTEIWFD